MYKQSAIVITMFLGSSQAWAVGMNGDEDLGQDITMKGQKFHYAQEEPAAKFDANQGPEKVDTLNPVAAKNRTTFYGQEEQPEAENYIQTEWSANSEPEKVHTLQTKIARSHTSYYVQTGAEEEWSANDQPEKVHTL